MSTETDTTTEETTTETTETTDKSLLSGEPRVEEKSGEETKTEETVVEPLTAEALTFPEGIQVDEAARDEFLGILNNRELTPAAQAQALVDLQVKLAQQASETGSNAWTELQTKWVDEVKADPDIGGDKLEPILTSIGKAIDDYGTPELREVFAITGAGNNPHVIKFLSKLASAVNEGTHIQGKPGGTGERTEDDVAERLYPSMAKRS